MSIFDRFLRRQKRGRWYIKVDLITDLAEIARNRWRREWAALVGRSHADVADPLSESSPGRRSEAALIRLQLYCFSESIRKQGYLAEDEVDAFLRFLATSMEAGSSGEAADAATAVLPADAAGEVPAVAAAEAVAAELAGGTLAARERIQRTLDLFGLEQEYVAALAFNDRITAQRLKHQIEVADLGAPLEG